MLLIFVLAISACGRSLERPTEDQLIAAIQSTIDEQKATFEYVFNRRVDHIGPVFYEGTNGRAVFTMKDTSSAVVLDGEARLSRAEDGKWYLVSVWVRTGLGDVSSAVTRPIT